MSSDLTDRAKQIIENLLYITVATVCEDGTPWNTPVYSAYDENYNFYWGSHVGSQHSENIKANPNIFIVIYDPHAPAGQGEGVYIRATATTVDDPEEIEAGYRVLESRGSVPWTADELKGNSPVKLYKAVAEKFWTNQDSELDGHFIDVREELNL